MIYIKNIYSKIKSQNIIFYLNAWLKINLQLFNYCIDYTVIISLVLDNKIKFENLL